MVTQSSLPWLHLSDAIGISRTLIRLVISQLPECGKRCQAVLYLGDSETPLSELSRNATSDYVLNERQKTFLEFLQSNATLWHSGTLSLSPENLSFLFLFVHDVVFELKNEGTLIPMSVSVRLTSECTLESSQISFVLQTSTGEKIEKIAILGHYPAYIVDKQLRLFMLRPEVLPNEAEALLNSLPLSMTALQDINVYEVLEGLAKLGINLESLRSFHSHSSTAHRIVLRVIPETDKQGILSLRMHLVTQFTEQGEEEVEIPARQDWPPVFITSRHQVLQRPVEQEQAARETLFALGAQGTYRHKGFRIRGEEALQLLTQLTLGEGLPPFIFIEKDNLPHLIDLSHKPHLLLSENPEQKSKNLLAQIKILDDAHPDVSLLRKHLSLEKLVELYLLNQRSLLLEDDRLVLFSQDSLKNLIMLSEVLGISRLEQTQKVSFSEAAMLYLALHEQVRISAHAALQKRLADFDVRSLPEDGFLPKALCTPLRPYQHDALKWLCQLHRVNLGRILADDMGLGKTLMVLTFLAKLKEQHGSQPSLVVAPTSVIDVWINEAKRHIPSLKCLKWHGASRREQLEEALESDVIVTSYALLRRDIDDYLSQIACRYFIIDEAQNVKNSHTESWKTANRVNSEHRLALTGTPIENRLEDLFSILDLVEKGVLGSEKTFQKRYAQPISQGNVERTEELRLRVHPLILRRRKQDVESDLPPKIENVLRCAMTPVQKELYRYVLQNVRNEIFDKGLSSQMLSSTLQMSMLAALTRLRQICCDPRILLGPEAAKEEDSSKGLLLLDTLKECLEAGRKIILYSQFVKMHGYLHEILHKAGIHNPLWLHGGSKNRADIVNRFQEDETSRAIIVSLKAGGTGITLTAADTVIFYDPWWNPAVEDQAADRAHRIGQTKAVHVIKLICNNSIEEQMIQLSESKRITAQNVLTHDQKGARTLSLQEVQRLLSVEIQRTFE